MFKFDFQCYLSGVRIMSELHKVSSRSCSNSSQPRLRGCEQISVDQTASNAECLANLPALLIRPKTGKIFFLIYPRVIAMVLAPWEGIKPQRPRSFG